MHVNSWVTCLTSAGHRDRPPEVGPCSAAAETEHEDSSTLTAVQWAWGGQLHTQRAQGCEMDRDGEAFPCSTPTWGPYQHLAEAVTVLLGHETSTSKGPAPSPEPSLQEAQRRAEGPGPRGPGTGHLTPHSIPSGHSSHHQTSCVPGIGSQASSAPYLGVSGGHHAGPPRRSGVRVVLRSQRSRGLWEAISAGCHGTESWEHRHFFARGTFCLQEQLPPCIPFTLTVTLWAAPYNRPHCPQEASEAV